MADKPVYNRKTTVKEDIKEIVKSVAQIISPKVLRPADEDGDSEYRRRAREGQSTDSNNKY